MNDYRVFGLKVRSEIPLPELMPCDGTTEPDVTIRLSDVGTSLSTPGIHVIDGDLLVVAEGAARYRISNGRKIIVEPVAGAPERNLRLFLLGSAFGVLLHQRGLLPLHANAVEIGGKAFAFMGESGAGKSTLAAWFYDKGYAVLADDVSVVAPDRNGTPVVRQGLRRLRLWKDALELSGRSTSDYEISFADEASYEKYDVPLRARELGDCSMPAGAVYLLERGDTFELAQLSGVDAVECLMANTYRGQMAAAAGGSRMHWESCVALARQAPIFRCRRIWGYEHFDEQMTALVEHARSTLDVAKAS